MSETDTILARLSRQSVDLLEKLAAQGIYGVDREEVAARMIDASLLAFIERGLIEMPHPRAKRKKGKNGKV